MQHPVGLYDVRLWGFNARYITTRTFHCLRWVITQALEVEPNNRACPEREFKLLHILVGVIIDLYTHP